MAGVSCVPGRVAVCVGKRRREKEIPALCPGFPDCPGPALRSRSWKLLDFMKSWEAS